LAGSLDAYTAAQLKTLSKAIKGVYGQAAKEVQHKFDDFVAGYRRRAADMMAKVASGELSVQDYKSWLMGQVFQGKRWRQRIADMTGIYVRADKEARSILGGSLTDIFAASGNKMARQIAYDLNRTVNAGISFTMWDRATVNRLIKDNPKMLPEWRINEPKDYVWNEARVRNAVTQGILQGESIGQIGKRLEKGLATSNATKMRMFARTAVTGAQNAGRVERMRDAEQSFGIKCQKVWLTAEDDRVRTAHIKLDGVAVDYDEPFIVPDDGRKIDFPGDPNAEPDLVYNCRCTLLYKSPHMARDYRTAQQRQNAYARGEHQ